MSSTTSPVAGALAPGTRLLEYRIERVLGTGGFGITYAAYDTHLDKTVAIKEYLPAELAVRQDPNTVSVRSEQSRAAFTWGREQFLKEARVVARFSHANLIHVYRFFEANETAYFVMEYADGTTLEELLKREGQLSEGAIRSVLMPVLDGLREVHRARVLHRDIKPSNIIVRKDGSPVLIDFGSARQNVGSMTRSIMSVVTAGYAPIEQYAADGHQGPWTDIYGIGAVAYRAIAGKRPSDAVTRMRRDPMSPASVVGAGKYAAHFLKAIDWALRVNPEDRPVGIADWRQALDGALAPPPPREGLAAPITATTWQNLVEQLPTDDKAAAEGQEIGSATQHVTPLRDGAIGTATKVVRSDLLPPLEALAPSAPPVAAGVAGAVAPPVEAVAEPAAAPPPADEHAPLPPPPGPPKPLFPPPILPKQPPVRQAVPRPAPPIEPPPLVFATPRGDLEDPPTRPVHAPPPPSRPWGLIGAAIVALGAAGGWWIMNQESRAPLPKRPRAAATAPATGADPAAEAASDPATAPAPVETAVGIERMSAQSSFQDCGTCPVMMVMPSGSFLMGSPPDPGISRTETPAHRVTIAHRLAIARDEITIAEWDACVAGGGCSPSGQTLASGDPRLPVVGVSFDDAARYAAWLSRVTRRHYRLPTEAEWEYAARAGTMTAHFWASVEGDAICNHANSADIAAKKELARGSRFAACEDGFATLAPVGSFAANGYGLRDMAGNVAEWTIDCWRESYTDASTDGSALLTPGCTQHTVRGGGWRSTQGALRTAAREPRTDESRHDDLGFRVVAD